jgi:pimeloyl-ACP methyl ester carboxylesterase
VCLRTRRAFGYDPANEAGFDHEVYGAGEPLVLVHGTGGSLRVWDPVVPLLAARRTVISVDLPGFGASPPLTPPGPPPTPAGFAVVLADLLRQLGHSTAHVAGKSVGGWTALEMAKLGAARWVVALSSAGLWAGRVPLYDVLSLGGTRRFCRLFDFLMPVLLSRPLWRRKLMMWQNIARRSYPASCNTVRQEGVAPLTASAIMLSAGAPAWVGVERSAFFVAPEAGPAQR